MKNEHIDDDLLWTLIDGNLTPDQRVELEGRLANDKALSNRLKELRQLNDLAKTAMVKSPVEGFTMKIMSQLESRVTNSRRSDWWLLVAVLFTVFFGGYYMSQFDTNLSMMLDVSELPRLNQYVDILNFNDTINLDIISKGLLYGTLLLALVLFDKIVLNPFFKKRRLAS